MDIDLNEFINSVYNQTTGIEFSWDMTLRAFIQWALDQPFISYAFIILLIICGKILFYFIKNPPQN